MRASEYPTEYKDTFIQALDDPVTLYFSTRKRAKNYRSELYKFRYAVRDELPLTNELYKKLMKVQLKIKGANLILSRKKAKFLEKLI